jgi:hypothetical protein
MMSIKSAVSPNLRPWLQRAIQLNGARPMSILSKDSAEEYKKKVRQLNHRHVTMVLVLATWTSSSFGFGFCLIVNFPSLL